MSDATTEKMNHRSSTQQPKQATIIESASTFPETPSNGSNSAINSVLGGASPTVEEIFGGVSSKKNARNGYITGDSNDSQLQELLAG